MINKLSILYKEELRELEKELERQVERDFIARGFFPQSRPRSRLHPQVLDR